jgi:hypothetical protein
METVTVRPVALLLALIAVVVLGRYLQRGSGRRFGGAVLVLLMIAAALWTFMRPRQADLLSTRTTDFTTDQTEWVTTVVTETVPESSQGVAERIAGQTQRLTAPERGTPLLGQGWEFRWPGPWAELPVAALAAMILLAYLFLGPGTRGQRTWPRRVFAVAAFVAICVMLVVLRPGF